MVLEWRRSCETSSYHLMAALSGRAVKKKSHFTGVGSARSAVQKETRFKLRVQEDLKRLEKHWSFKTQQLALMGIPDIIGVINGRFFALELKSEKKKPSKLQSYILRRIDLAGGYARAPTPETWAGIFQELVNLQGSPSVGPAP